MLNVLLEEEEKEEEEEENSGGGGRGGENMNNKMATNIYLSTNLKYKINKPGNRLIDTENILRGARWEGGWEVGEKVKGLRSISWLLQNSHGDVKYSIGNIVNNAIVTYDVRWVGDLSG